MVRVTAPRVDAVRRTLSTAVVVAVLAVAWAAVLVPIASAAPTGPYFGPNIRVDRVPAYTGTSPSLAIGSNGVAYLAFAGSGGTTTLSDIFFTKSSDGGKIWTLPVRVNNDAGAAAQTDPSLGIGGANALYVVWTDNRNGNNDIFFSRSTDGGLSFSANVRVNDVTTSFQQEADVAVDPTDPDLVHAMWTDNRNQFTTGPDIYYANSTDGGLSFNPSRRVNTDATGVEQGQPAIAVAPDASLYAVWGDPRAAARGRDILTSKSADRGATWTPEIVLNDDTGNTVQTEPAIAIDAAGFIYVAWTDSRNANTAPDIYATRSTNAGASFAANVQVNDDLGPAIQNQPSLSVSPGKVQVAWTDTRTAGSTFLDVYTATSANGIAWGANMKVNDDLVASVSQTQPSVALDAVGNVYAAWLDTRASGQNVFAAMLDVVGPTANAGSAVTVDVGTEVAFDGSASADNREIVGYEWDFDDGLGATGPTARHTYAAAGTYNATLTVWDGSGNLGTSVVAVTVRAASPTPADLLGQIRYLQVIIAALTIGLALLAWMVLGMRKREGKSGTSELEARTPPPPRDSDPLDLPLPPAPPKYP